MQPAERALHRLSALQRADISAIEARLPTGHQSFFKSLAVETLSESMRKSYSKLAVLLEDVPAPLAVCGRCGTWMKKKV
jgi:hypothetical protein